MLLWILAILALTAAILAPFSALPVLMLLPAALSYVGQRGLAVPSQLAWLLAGWLFWLPVSLLWSLTPGLSIPQVMVLLCLPLGWLAGMRLRKHLDVLLEVGFPCLLAALLLWGLLQGPNTFTSKPQGPFNDPNTYASTLNLLVLPILARYLAVDLASIAAWRRTGQLALWAGVAFVAFLSASRGASLAFMLVLPPLLWLARHQPDFKRKLALLATVALTAYFAAFTVSDGLSVALRLANTIQGGDPSRIMLMQSAWLMIQEHPWLGTGLGTFRLLYPRYRFADEPGTAGGWVHNDYLQLWLEAGLPMMLLMLGLAAWVAWAGWRTLRENGARRNNDALIRMGYLAAIAAILLHALVNFLFFFAPVSLLVGLYLARLMAPPFAIGERGGDFHGLEAAAAVDISHTAHISKFGESHTQATPHIRAIRLAAGGYVLIIGWLVLGQVIADGILGRARTIQRAMQKWDVAYPSYEAAYWVSVLAPMQPGPQQVMGLELAEVSVLTGGGSTIRDEALRRMEAGWQRAPCYLPNANDALALISRSSDAALSERGLAIITRNFDCNARHGLSYYYAGRLARTEAEALDWWRAGMAASPYLGDDLLLAASILARTLPGQGKSLTALAEQMAQALQYMEAHPGVHPDQTFWDDAQRKLYHLAGNRFLELVPPPIAK